MFRHLPVYEQGPATLEALGREMIRAREPDKPLLLPAGERDEDENDSTLDGELRLPAGYTYFGQFVDHDITFDPASSLTRQNDPDALTNFRTPRFDLDSLYGGGPATQPYLYQDDRVKLALAPGGRDLQRNEKGRALIGDPRNDENLIISQLQVAFIRFHNAVVDHCQTRRPALRGDDLLKLAQQTVRWHYQWVVVHDFLRRLVGQDVVADILRDEAYAGPTGKQKTVRPHLLFYDWKERPFMPVEFSVAAYRFGHSMARPSYLINDHVRPAIEGSHRIPLFRTEGDVLLRRPPVDSLADLSGFRHLPDRAEVRWKYFLPVEHRTWPNADGLPQPSYRIDTELGHPLGRLPDSVATAQHLFPDVSDEAARSLAVRNLLRGRALDVPSGQDVARAMGVPLLVEPEREDEFLRDLRLDLDARRDLRDNWPLWFYVLKEAEVATQGAHLGPVGGRIVAEVLIGLLCGDPLSYLGVAPTWEPFLPGTDGKFTLTDLVRFGLEAEDRSPILP